MNYSISNTAEYGETITGPRIVTDETKKEMKRMLADIQSGKFARGWMLESKVNRTSFKATRANLAQHPIEEDICDAEAARRCVENAIRRGGQLSVARVHRALEELQTKDSARARERANRKPATEGRTTSEPPSFERDRNHSVGDQGKHPPPANVGLGSEAAERSSWFDRVGVRRAR
jgi:hypothetical protein